MAPSLTSLCGSTAQVGLAKIIATIVAGPAPTPPAIDLRLTLGPSTEIQRGSSLVDVSGDIAVVAGAESNKGECDVGDLDVGGEEEGKEQSEVTNAPIDEASEEIDGGGYLYLLIEAVHQISSGDTIVDNVAKRRSRQGATATATVGPSKRRAAPEDCLLGFDGGEGLGPVVRSKRGRNQALPSRYRDTVLEPWRKL